MRIIVDVMSGDKAPLEPVTGALNAAKLYTKAEIIMVGNEEIIHDICKEKNIKLPVNCTIENCEEVLTMEDDPLSIVRAKSNSSMAVALKMLSEGKGDAVISAGNTGALHAGSTLIVRRIKGIKRSAIATLIPFANPTLLIDSGANTQVTKEQLGQFAIMGSIYMEKMLGVANPRVGLANIGVEEHKGTPEIVEAYNYLKTLKGINFVGNVEGKEVPFGCCDVLVCDGFTGNMILKYTEGVSSYLLKKIKEALTSSISSKLPAAMLKGKLKKLKQDFSASEFGAAPMLGISKPVLKAHGNSDAEEIQNSVRQAINFVSSELIYDISTLVSNPKEDSEK